MEISLKPALLCYYPQKSVTKDQVTVALFHFQAVELAKVKLGSYGFIPHPMYDIHSPQNYMWNMLHSFNVFVAVITREGLASREPILL